MRGWLGRATTGWRAQIREHGGMRLFVAGGTGLIESNVIRCVLHTQRDVIVTEYDNRTFACDLASPYHVAEFDRFESVHDDIADRATGVHGVGLTWREWRDLQHRCRQGDEQLGAHAPHPRTLRCRRVNHRSRGRPSPPAVVGALAGPLFVTSHESSTAAAVSSAGRHSSGPRASAAEANIG